MPNHQGYEEVFEFPPGHKIKIKKFIEGVKKQYCPHPMFNSQKRKAKSAVSKQVAKKKKLTSHMMKLQSISTQLQMRLESKYFNGQKSKSDLCLRINTSRLL